LWPGNQVPGEWFQSTHPHGVRRYANPHRERACLVSIHAPAWGATLCGDAYYLAILVSIHAPAWGATDGIRDISNYLSVSIHAPAWGATQSRCHATSGKYVSIHAPAWGATCSDVRGRSVLQRFNPRTRMGCDVGSRRWKSWACVSIHAPAWGATQSSTLPSQSAMFQSTHPHGVRRPADVLRPQALSFNPRTRMGCDSMPPGILCATHSFNPRTRMGCDVFLPSHNRCDVVSIHAPAWGATTKRSEQQLARVVSIHAPAWGATQNIV